MDKKQCSGGTYQSSPGDKIKSAKVHTAKPNKLSPTGGSHLRGKQG